MTSKNTNPLPGWDQLRHGGLLLDGPRLLELAKFVPPPLDDYTSQKLRQHANALLEEPTNRSQFVRFVLEAVCGIDEDAGFWDRGSRVAPKWNRQTVTGESLKPDHLWRGKQRGLLPVFIDKANRIGVGNGRWTVSRALGWLRTGNDSLAILTNGLQWRLLFAGLDYDAWCEWDLALWFEEGELSSQVTCLRTLIQAQVWEPEHEGSEAPLLKAIRDTRKGQADLSESLGERVRKAVEILIQVHGDALKELDSVERADIYRAACRIVMRCVVILFAESRELLPRNNALYHEGYGLNGLMEQLDHRAAHKHALADCYAAWPRILALFRLVYEGSHHPDLPIVAYGGGLFEPGRRASEEGISRALAVLESDCYENTLLPDQYVRQVLQHLTRTTIRVRQGHATARIEVPVDFSDLSSEYIGLLYEGLLDYDLRTAPPDEPVVFLSIGNQPALPLSTLEEMNDSTVKALFNKMSKKDQADKEHDARDAESRTAPRPPELVQESTERNTQTTDNTENTRWLTDDRQQSRVRTDRWARRAVRVAGLVNHRGRRKTREELLALEREIDRKIKELVKQVVLPGEWYLVRWGGTRKGSGSFYTRPGLAIPTVQRTLRPLVYIAAENSNCSSDTAALRTAWKPKTPEQILAVTVCDPACGSGTFPLAALRFLTEALYLSIRVHGRIKSRGARSIVNILRDSPSHLTNDESLRDEHLPCTPNDNDFEPRLKAILRRYVVERCIYAVDIDPLAVELCRISLWIETMDRNLPFGFLNHKVKCGNALIGTWLDQFQHYPVMAWKNRDGGDRNHSNGVHFKQNSRTNAIKRFVNDKLKPDLIAFLQGQTLFQEDYLKEGPHTHRKALQILERIHALPVHDSLKSQQIYYDSFIGSEDWKALKSNMDLWCACWFWPLDDTSIAEAPLPTSMASPSDETRCIVKKVTSYMKFFHWELEFPDVFRAPDFGFSAVLGNPPWDLAKPASREFFANLDPLYNTYGKQEALRHQFSYFRNKEIEQSWLDYNARFRAQSNFAIFGSNPWGDPSDDRNSGHRFSITRGKNNIIMHERWKHWRTQFPTFSNTPHPFRYQGGTHFNLYKLFLELAHNLLRNPRLKDHNLTEDGGRLGFVVPSGIYSDHATQQLRDLFLSNFQWEWLFSFENRERIFPIDGRQKFCVVIANKGGQTESIHTQFMCRDVADWAQAEASATPYGIAQVKRFSPKTHSILEVQSQIDLALLETIYLNGCLLGEGNTHGWRITYATEFNPTTDSQLFHSRRYWEDKGYIPDEYNRWVQGDWRHIDELWRIVHDHHGEANGPVYQPKDLVSDTTNMPADISASDRDTDSRSNGPSAIVSFQRFSGIASQAFDQLPILRASLPSGMILSRDCDRWIHEDNITSIALPVYEGRMIGQFDFSQKAWISGTGRSAVWSIVPWESKLIDPQFLMHQDIYNSRIPSPTMPKCTHMRVASATNSRTAISTMAYAVPGTDTAAMFRSPDLSQVLALNGIINSLVFDFATRLRLVGLHLDYHVLEQNVLPHLFQSNVYSAIIDVVARLNLSAALFSPYLIRLDGAVRNREFSLSLTQSERCRSIAILNALVSASYGIDTIDMARIIQDCDIPVARLHSSEFTRRLDPKGFWRIDQHKDPELRSTILSFVAFCDLTKQIEIVGGDVDSGVGAFLDQNDGQGWMLPDQLRLRDYGIGQDQRAEVPQFVAPRLGPRFHDWQLVQSSQDFWREAHLHARNILGAEDYSALIAEIVAGRIDREASSFDRLVNDLSQDFISGRGYLDVLLELRRRRLVDPDKLVIFAVALRDKGHLDARLYLEFIDTVSVDPADADSDSSSSGRPQLDLFKWRRQVDLFE